MSIARLAVSCYFPTGDLATGHTPCGWSAKFGAALCCPDKFVQEISNGRLSANKMLVMNAEQAGSVLLHQIFQSPLDKPICTRQTKIFDNKVLQYGCSFPPVLPRTGQGVI